MTRTPPAWCELGANETLREANLRLVRAFSQAGLESPEADARFLMRGVLSLQAADLLRHPDRQLGPAALVLNAAAARRLKREPVSRILGIREFYGRDFEISPAVLDPRPDTETLVEEIVSLVRRKGWADRPLQIADIGVGSGAILLTLLCELPNAHGLGTDISAAALAVARRNAARLGVAARFRAVESSILTRIGEPIDIVVSNPPYIPSGEISSLAEDVRLFDPHIALDGGPDGLAVYRQIASQVRALGSVSCVVLEAGAQQAEDIADLFGNLTSGEDLWQASFRDDLGGHRRCVTLERHCRQHSAKTVGSSIDTR